ncbi:MAG: polyphosphate polymerase domain-containing protein [Bacteroidales bacterium]|nr:polyphosphate polymerase domain-containing protein [Bacteroidales bacterium]
MEMMHTSIEEAARRIPSITLEEMDGVKLLNRIDTKYLTNEATLLEVLSDAMAAGYRALEAEGEKVSPYNSIYYDTPGMKMFLDHHNRRLVRQKVRTREYVNSGTAFLEIKRKNNHGRTKKKRIEIPENQMFEFAGNPEACDYLARHSWFTAGDIRPVLSTAFRRITLVNPAKTERLTIDTSLLFTNYQTGKKASLEDAVIIELKQDGHTASQMKGILLEHRVKPVRVSKYCIAVTLTDPSIKSGRFKVKVRAIEKTINKRISVTASENANARI